ncbi:MAG: ABC transporter ATP-binding protein, partial [Candidatus Acidiferrales bacterium]
MAPATTIASPLLDIRGLTVELPTPAGWIRPVNDVALVLAAGEAVALVGESGSGKTMLALALMGLLPPGARVSGEACFASVAPGCRPAHSPANAAPADAGLQADATSPASPAPGAEAAVNLTTLSDEQMRPLRGREIAMIFQEPMTALNPVMRVGAQIAEAVRVHHRGLARGEVRKRAVAALARAAVPEPESRERQYPHQLSGGLRQRAMIAMALASGLGQNGSTGPRLLIADEPTTALDVTVQKQILDLLARLRAELGMALLFITHDLGVAAQIAERIAVMYAGRIVELGPSDRVLRAPLHPYTQGLLRAAPRLASRTLEPIAGTVPRLDALPPGCAFEPRCP